ncbi:hypothetical protein CGLO_00797 [Colletotrichum gloeosporioides Cg-14]|uniref:Uncharacterized protein n=1 Tax=Colletotrichum gloeosporioides (strain Cg-14) TaxID=1237896 RepID=T0M5S4_COLGC|nr:hypothetical protein CGLO_00797 [Colletotrichum gloeosporioides Cg-14]
MLISVDKDRI